MLDALTLLTNQHTETDELLAKLDEAKSHAAKTAVFGELADKLAAHMAIEEEIFYPAIFVEKLENKLREATEEHLAIKRVLADLMAMDPMDEQFAAKLSVMGEQLSHHAHEEEEQELFPKLRRMLSSDELAALGNELLARFEALLATHASEAVPNDTAEAAPLGA